jgi:hypothetical protein
VSTEATTAESWAILSDLGASVCELPAPLGSVAFITSRPDASLVIDTSAGPCDNTEGKHNREILKLSDVVHNKSTTLKRQSSSVEKIQKKKMGMGRTRRRQQYLHKRESQQRFFSKVSRPLC